MSEPKHYRRIAFLAQPKVPGGVPHVFDTSRGGSIVRTIDGASDSVVVSAANGTKWECPWSAVAWATPGESAPPLAKAKKERGFRHRVRQEVNANGTPLRKAAPPPEPAPEEDAEVVDADGEPKTETRARSDAWSPPKKPNPKKLGGKPAPTPAETPEP